MFVGSAGTWGYFTFHYTGFDKYYSQWCLTVTHTYTHLAVFPPEWQVKHFTWQLCVCVCVLSTVAGVTPVSSRETHSYSLTHLPHQLRQLSNKTWDFFFYPEGQYFLFQCWAWGCKHCWFNIYWTNTGQSYHDLNIWSHVSPKWPLRSQAGPVAARVLYIENNDIWLKPKLYQLFKAMMEKEATLLHLSREANKTNINHNSHPDQFGEFSLDLSWELDQSCVCPTNIQPKSV